MTRLTASHLYQSKSDGVKDESDVQTSPLEMAPDSLDGIDDVLQPLPIGSGHNGIASASMASCTTDRRLSEGATLTDVPST